MLDGDFGHRLTLLALAAFSAAWVTAVGAAVGSFLNVVVWRLPRGMSLVKPKSRCPACGTPIRAGDNVPVLGWLRLRGRCRACGGAISARYPLVEAATAVLFLGLAHFELFSGAANLPGGTAEPSGLAFALWHLRSELIAVYIYHVVLLTTLLAAALIVYDGFPPPQPLVAPVALLGFVAPLVFVPRPVSAGVRLTFLPAGWLPLGGEGVRLAVYPQAVLDGTLGLAVGTVVGLTVASAAPTGSRRKADRGGTVAAGALIGLFLGWQAVVSCGLTAVVLAAVNAIASRLTRRSLPVTGLLATAAAVQVVSWKALSKVEWWPGPTGWKVIQHAGWPTDGSTLDSAVISSVAVLAATAVAAWAVGKTVAGGETSSVEVPDEASRSA